MKSTRIIFVGGFLGAGKTTLLWSAAQCLMEKGLRVGLITNDQAPELVDTALLSCNGLKVSEVSGSCFCCNFNGLEEAVRKVGTDAAADVILAEPVGSCTDLSATIMQPLKQYMKDVLRLAPLSVLADPIRLEAILDGGTSGLHPDAAYIFRKQLEESDIILITKTDRLQPSDIDRLVRKTQVSYPAATVMSLSAESQQGVGQWLDYVMQCNVAGTRLVDIDYDVYANGEAVLGWLNGTVRLKGNVVDWNVFVRDFLTDLGNRFDKAGYPVGHVKVILENGNQFVTGNLTGKLETISIRGSVEQNDDVKLTINARVETNPENLENIVREVLADSTSGCCDADIVAWRCLSPGRPNPTHRFEYIVEV